MLHYILIIKLEKYSKIVPFYTSEDLKPHPVGGAMVQTVTGNLVEVSSAERIEIFNGVNGQGCIYFYDNKKK